MQNQKAQSNREQRTSQWNPDYMKLLKLQGKTSNPMK